VRTYTELIALPSFEERYRYLKLSGEVGKATFGWDRYLNQNFYNSPEWRKIRRNIILRDNGCDLGIEGREIGGKIFIHHMNPVTVYDICKASDFLLNPEYLICVSQGTHNAIHYGDESLLDLDLPERMAGDTCPWKTERSC